MAFPRCSGVSTLKGKCARGQCDHSILSRPVTVKPTWKDARRSFLYNLIPFTVFYAEWWPVVQSEAENGPSAPCPREWQVLEEEMWNCVPTPAGLLGQHWGTPVCCSGARVFLRETGSVESNRSKQEDSRAARWIPSCGWHLDRVPVPVCVGELSLPEGLGQESPELTAPPVCMDRPPSASFTGAVPSLMCFPEDSGTQGWHPARRQAERGHLIVKRQFN